MKKVLVMTKGEELWDKAQQIIPGGNMLLSKNKNLFSPSFWPTYYKQVKGIKVWDLDGNKFLDFCSNGVGACTLGHSNNAVDNAVKKTINSGVMSTLNTPNEVYLAQKLIEINPWAQMVKFARSGGEANAIAIRIARSHSKREKVAICGYHGWHDWYLAANLENTNTLDDHLLSGLKVGGVPKSLSGSVYPIRYNNFDDLDILYEQDIGTLKMEVTRNQQPKEGYLERIRDICTSKGIVLIFDECTSGFRETFGGIHAKYNIEPDICMYGKALGNGYAITAVVGKGKIMQDALLSFISSTFWTEAIGPTAALATLSEMENKKTWEILPKTGKKVKDIWERSSQTCELPILTQGIDALPTFQFLSKDPLAYKTFFTEEMLSQGFLASTLFYPTIAHTNNDLKKYEKAVINCFAKLADMHKVNSDVRRSCKGIICEPTFKRLA